VPVPSWLVDEMLGRLARYLRFVGCDTVYVRGTTDDQLLERARDEHRVLLTRDRELSRRGPNVFLVGSPVLREQWQAIRAAWPELPVEPSFDRCTRCNGRLALTTPADRKEAGETLPPSVRRGDVPLYACRSCGHLYWEGSHTARVRAQLLAWAREPGP